MLKVKTPNAAALRKNKTSRSANILRHPGYSCIGGVSQDSRPWKNDGDGLLPKIQRHLRHYQPGLLICNLMKEVYPPTEVIGGLLLVDKGPLTTLLGVYVALRGPSKL